jgi:hypothetical protein
MMDAMLLLAIEADKKKKPEHKCAMEKHGEDMQKAIAGIGKAVYALRDDVAEVAGIATKAANKKAPTAAKPVDYSMEVVRDADGFIQRVDVKVIK